MRVAAKPPEEQREAQSNMLKHGEVLAMQVYIWSDARASLRACRGSAWCRPPEISFCSPPQAKVMFRARHGETSGVEEGALYRRLPHKVCVRTHSRKCRLRKPRNRSFRYRHRQRHVPRSRRGDAACSVQRRMPV